MMRSRSWFLAVLVLILLPAGRLAAQADSVRLSNDYAFADGLYFDHAAMRANQPDLRWNEVEAQVVVNNTTFQARLGPVRVKRSGRLIPASELWGFSRQGVPYLRVAEVEATPPVSTMPIPGPSASSAAATGSAGQPGAASGPEAASGESAIVRFSGLQYTGRIAYFGFPDDSTRMVTIKAYNPLTGKPFREGQVPRTETFYREFILHMVTGEIAPLNWPQLRSWIRDDVQLLQQLGRLEEDELDLIRVLQTYDSRNPFYMAPSG